MAKADGRDEAVLRAIIRLNEALPRHMRCGDAIAAMRMELTRLQWRHRATENSTIPVASDDTPKGELK
jgi:hypothetical protein